MLRADAGDLTETPGLPLFGGVGGRIEMPSGTDAPILLMNFAEGDIDLPTSVIQLTL